MSDINVDIKELLSAGAHFGHKTSRWHPKMNQYIHSKRGGIHIIDLTKTVDGIEKAMAFITKEVASGKQVLLVSTKRQGNDAIKEVAESTGMPYVVNRWVGGMLTNSNTMNVRVKYLKDTEMKMQTGELAAKYNKLEVQRFQEEIEAMNHLYEGIKDMAGNPGVVFIVDITHDHNALKEAKKLNIPVVGLADTNANPDLVDYPIPANDDSIKTVELIAGYLKQAIEAGKATAKPAKTTEK